MDYEKKYKSALERAKQFSEKPLLEDSAGIVEYIFPELAESDDERIIGVFRELAESYLFWEKLELTKEKALAWLEKQGEQKPFDYEHATIQQRDFAPKQASPVLSNSSNVGKDEQNPAWSEEDEEIIKLINFALLHLPSQREDTRLKCFNWLESLKDRVK